MQPAREYAVKDRLKDSAHLVMLVVVFFAALAVFLLLRQSVVPKSFGVYGHFRADSLKDNRMKPISYAGQETCAACHDDVAGVRSKGAHHGVSCEICHGPQAAHADDPSSGKPPKPQDVKALCVNCHEADTAKPRKFPQVVPADHSGGAACNECHQPHSPGM